MTSSRFGHWLKKQRLARKLTQGDLEQQAGLGYSYVSRIERGRTKLPEEYTRARIHSVLGTSDEDLVGEGILTKVTHGGTVVYLPSEEPFDESVRTTEVRYLDDGSSVVINTPFPKDRDLLDAVDDYAEAFESRRYIIQDHQSAEAPVPDSSPAHLRTSFAKARELSREHQKELDSFIDYLGLKEGKNWANTRSTATEPESIPDDFDPDDETPITFDIPRS